ncbi:dehydratase [Paraburkholderia sp. Tr-20389]|uniref:MaoC family dehydratase n=1 Tax=Paraburkholderia sp. Tr-20389 TaxID=2703903 RepID=UPI00197E2641|nr:MaoC/PaaZ C-terminal domain-containing protein [Paraburkholderia sp. Tr-20389]MBN3753723.1 dehydratase [Paraburkholderia sp. Tr-20389]
MVDFPVSAGERFEFRKTISESDVYLFAGITGDLSPNHVDEEQMKRSRYGGRIAHGGLLVGYMSACSTMASERFRNWNGKVAVSLGYDRIRFLQGVRIGETIAVHYEVTSIDRYRLRSTADVKITTSDGCLAAVAQHILKWVNAEE